MAGGEATLFARRREILTLLEEGVAYAEIGRRLDIHPGLAYLVATGLPADGSDAPQLAARERPGFLPSSQHLSNPLPVVNPVQRSSTLEWIRGRVAADEPMRLAAAGRAVDAGLPPPAAAEDEPDAVDVLTRDHNRATALLKKLAAIPGVSHGGSPEQLSARRSIVDLLVTELSRHAAAEQRCLWPTVREVLPDGDQRAETGLEQERRGEELLSALTGLDPSDQDFDDLVEQLSEASRKHVAFQARVFLALRESMSREDLRSLGTGLTATEHEVRPWA
jgi:Hemerythrin HHE cation binding domain